MIKKKGGRNGELAQAQLQKSIDKSDYLWV